MLCRLSLKPFVWRWDDFTTGSDANFDEVAPGIYVGNHHAAKLSCWQGVVCCAPRWQKRIRTPMHVFDIEWLPWNSCGISQVRAMLQFVRQYKDGKVLFHCKAGRHRAASTAAMVLVCIGGFTAEASIDRVVTARSRYNAEISGNLKDSVLWAESRC